MFIWRCHLFLPWSFVYMQAAGFSNARFFLHMFFFFCKTYMTLFKTSRGKTDQQYGTNQEPEPSVLPSNGLLRWAVRSNLYQMQSSGNPIKSIKRWADTISANPSAHFSLQPCPVLLLRVEACADVRGNLEAETCDCLFFCLSPCVTPRTHSKHVRVCVLFCKGINEFKTHRCFGARLELERLQQANCGNFELEQRESHSDAGSGAGAEWHVAVRVQVPHALVRKPACLNQTKFGVSVFDFCHVYTYTWQLCVCERLTLLK